MQAESLPVINADAKPVQMKSGSFRWSNCVENSPLENFGYRHVLLTLLDSLRQDLHVQMVKVIDCLSNAPNFCCLSDVLGQILPLDFKGISENGNL